MDKKRVRHCTTPAQAWKPCIVGWADWGEDVHSCYDEPMEDYCRNIVEEEGVKNEFRKISGLGGFVNKSD